MQTSEPTRLSIAVRVYPAPKDAPESRKMNKHALKTWRLPTEMLVFDTETTTDATQRLTFGSYRFFVKGRCLEEGLFYGDDLPAEKLGILRRYVATHPADTVQDGVRELRLLTRSEFVKELYRTAYKSRCLLVGFNLPFDLSRIAYDVAPARGRFAGGFSLGLWSYRDKAGREQPDKYRPRLCIKQIDSKRALKGFTARKNPDDSDLIPEGSPTGEMERGYKFRGHFMDLRTLAFALTDVGYSLDGACKAFGVENAKQSVAEHGVISEEYIDYNRRDVLATSELAGKLIEEFNRHPIALQATKAYSPASIGKAYLRQMRIRPILERQPDFSKQYLGHAQSAFFGGRTSAHIRKIPVPVVYTDFLSMYPTVNSLMGLWQFVTAQRIHVVKHCGKEIEEFLGSITADNLFMPDTWKKVTGFVRIIPNGDILPTRGNYSAASGDWQVAVNHLYGERDNHDHALWIALPDAVASVLLTGRIPKIIYAFRIEATGTLPGLKTVKLRGAVEIDPGKQDFFKVLIEERKRLSSRTDLSEADRKRLDKALKVTANAASYGIYAEMNRQEADESVQVTCHGIDADAFTCRLAHPDVPGEYCFPPLASLITGGARLMLACLEYCVAALGGTYAMEDTDSMAIVATEHGGIVPCHGGAHKTSDGRDGVKALTWKQVQALSQRFAALNPYDPAAIPRSILKIEDDNFDPATGNQRQIYCLAISAKRYALFVKNGRGTPVLLRKGVNNKEDRWSEHGLGHLLNPTDPESEDREWTAQIWLPIIRRAMGLPTPRLAFEDVPAIGRVSVSSPAVARPLAPFNEGKPYADQIKPFNFLLTAHVGSFGHPVGVNRERFHLIAPYETDPRKWLKVPWIDQYSGQTYRITTADHHGSRRTARVKTYGDVAEEYEYHPEAKCADTGGQPCGKQTIGLLQRRHVHIDQIKFIGKESNALEAVEAGMVHSAAEVYTEYADPRRDEWQTKTLPALKKLPLEFLVKKTGLSRRALMDLRAGRSRPQANHRKRLTEFIKAPK